MSRFSSEQEMRLVAAFFGNINGYFVGVGANDPQERSQTWHLERQGWTGVLIEPQSDLAAKLRAMRKARVFAAACSSPGNAGGAAAACRRTVVVARPSQHGAGRHA
ncbi:MAG TPA: hypothetical protein VKP52_02640 [Pseudolabrys sp.]|nr:hypothetical protein [Pseudolabrys sp.]